MAARKKPTTLEERLDALRDDLEALQTDMKGLAGGVGDAATARLNEMLSNTEDMAEQISAQVEDWTNDNAESLRETVREQPLTSMAIAMGVGALLGLILFRR
ncbi:MAG TPA: hypothetical protein VG867_10130 [Rhizomicrobium sp.]|nr:hypothetical protein [Rhizomicrobium sp.]